MTPRTYYAAELAIALDIVEEALERCVGLAAAGLMPWSDVTDFLVALDEVRIRLKS